MKRPWASGWVKADLRMLGTGQLDAGFAALAGFIAAAFAVRNLTAEQLGIYSLLFLAFGVASQIPTQLVLSSAEVLIAHSPLEQRLGAMRWSLPMGTVAAALASVTVAAGVLPLAGDVDLPSVTPLILTAVTFTLISPVQDHIRRVLHAADRSGQASVISALNLIFTTAAAVALLRVSPLWVPFGSMTIGNVISSCAVLFFSRGANPSTPSGIRQLVSIGRYLLVVGLANSGGKYLAGTLVGAIAGPAALGYVEAARLVARPSEVSAMGVLAATGPRLMVTSANRDKRAVKRLSRTYYAAVLAVGIVYTVLVATPVAWSIPMEVFPLAYEINGLVLAMLVAQLVINLTRPLQARLMGLRREVSLAVVEVLAQVGRLLASLSAFWVGAFGIPIGDFASHAYKLDRYARMLGDREGSASGAHDGESEEA
jgi:O-antigen/teichoic acid export membrane protein